MTQKKGKNWVDFGEIKKAVSLEMVIADHYGIELKPAGKSYKCICPFCDSKRAFSASLEKNAWQCFKCKKSGNQLDFVAFMESGNNETADIREAGLKLKDWFNMSSTDNSKLDRKGKKSVKAEKTKKKKPPAEKKENKPLKFSLTNVIPEHEFFEDKGIIPDTVKHFELGYYGGKGMMKDRIVTPIHNEKGELIGYDGRATSEEQAEEDGKYKQGFNKSLVLYNLHRLTPGYKILILVESVISVWWMYQAGIQNVVSTLGSSLSDEQLQLLIGYFEGNKGGIVLLYDDDEAGEKGGESAVAKLSRHFFVKWPKIGEYGRKPHQINPDDFKKII